MEGQMWKLEKKCKEEEGGQESEQSKVKTNVDNTYQRRKKRKKERDL